MREAATCRRGNENAGLGTNRFYREYLRRFPKDMPFELIEIPAGKRGKNADIKRILTKRVSRCWRPQAKTALSPSIFRASPGYAAVSR